jgi:hypothetical protein
MANRPARRLLPAVLTAAALAFGGVACDDNTPQADKIDEDDTNFGPGDGNDEVGPGR